MELILHQQKNVNVIELSGSFDIYNASKVRSCMDQVALELPVNIVVDLAQVDFIDSTALATLIHGKKIARENQGDIRLSGLRQPVRMVFELTRLDKVFEILGNQEEAIQAFS